MTIEGAGVHKGGLGLPPVMALTGLFPAAGMNLHIFWTMLAMHVVSALITVGLLTTLAAERR